MKRPVLILVLLAGIIPALYAQQTYLEVYGSVQTDINLSNEILQLTDTTFVLGGEWNGVGFLMKVNHKGTLLDYFFLDNTIPGNSAVTAMTLDPGGNIIATGECDHCAPGDSLKKIFTVATEPSLLLINSVIYAGVTPSNNQIYAPSIARKGNQLILAATTGGTGLNLEDIALFSITSNLDTLWRRTFNSCAGCSFDEVADIVPTSAGYAVLVVHGTDSLTLYHVNENGTLIWKKRNPVPAGTIYTGLEYRAGTIYACGSEAAGGHPGGFIRRFSESDGSPAGSMSLSMAGMADEVAGLRFSNDGTLLAIHRRAQPNSFGSYSVSRIYRVNVAASQVIDFTEIPNPDVLTGITAASVVPLTDDGTEMAVCGSQGFYSRSFFFSKNGVEPPPPGVVFDVSPDTACGPATIVLTNNFAGANSYTWRLDGMVFSTEQNPAPVAVAGAGTHEIKLDVVTGSQNKISNFTVISLPEIWNECPICDNKPDPYVVIKDAAGTVLYTSAWVESYPPVALPVSFTMSTSQAYKIEVWDDDNIGADDFFGVFTIPGNSAGGTFSLINPDDPDTPLTISFSTTLITQTQTFSQMVLVYQPTASLLPSNILSATPGNPAPPFYTWQWYLNGQPIPGATADTLAPGIGGSYAVAMVTPGCSALSNLVQFNPAFTSVNLDPVMPLCAGDANGAILVTPIGGTPPYSYAWNPSNVSGGNPEGLPAGDYAVTVTDALGQSVTAQITLAEPEPLTTTFDSENLACAGDSSGAILVTPAGGTGPFSYAWVPPSLTGSNPADLPAGSYFVTVTDANGCTFMAGETLVEPPELTAGTESTPYLEGTTILGTATVTAGGGTPPYTYVWSDPLEQTSQTAIDLEWGDYTVTVTDANGCTMEAMVSVDLVNATYELALAAFTIYPNPTSGLVFIETNTPVTGGGILEMSDPVGRVVRRDFFKKLPMALNLAELPDGLYLLSLKMGDGRIVKRVVVQR
jgi:SprB-like repeat protein/type IX secretion system substrate protein